MATAVLPAQQKALKLDTKSLNSRKMEKAQKIRIVMAHVQAMADQEVQCARRTNYNGIKCNCHCLHALFAGTSDKEHLSKAIATAVVDFYLMSKEQKRQEVANWIRYAQNREEISYTKWYLVPLHQPPSTDVDPVSYELPIDYKICQSALMGIMGFGTHIWKTYKKIAETAANQIASLDNHAPEKRKREDNSALVAKKSQKVGRSDDLSSSSGGQCQCDALE